MTWSMKCSASIQIPPPLRTSEVSPLNIDFNAIFMYLIEYSLLFAGMQFQPFLKNYHVVVGRVTARSTFVRHGKSSGKVPSDHVVRLGIHMCKLTYIILIQISGCYLLTFLVGHIGILVTSITLMTPPRRSYATHAIVNMALTFAAQSKNAWLVSLSYIAADYKFWL